jgi:outer membrane biosynthesis protein TonB
MKVRLAVDEMPMELKELQAKGKARQEGDDLVCQLALGTRGRATLGPYSVLFQVVRQTVTVPAVPKRNPLQGLVQSVLSDPPWWLSLAVSLLVIGGLTVQAHVFHHGTAKFLTTRAEEQAMQTTYEVEVVQKEEIKEPEPDKDEAEKEPDKPIAQVQAPQPSKKEDKPDKKADKPEPASKPADADKPQSVGKQVDPEEAKRQSRANLEKNTVMGALKDSMGASTKMFATGDDGEAGQVLARTFGGGGGDSENRGPGSSVKLGQSTAGGGGSVERIPKAGGKAGFKHDDNAVKDTGPKKQEEEVKVVLKSSGMEGGDGESKSEVGKIIARKNSAVQRCYEQALRDDPSTGGKVRVTFTVGTAGTVTDVSVSGASGSFSDCIKSKFNSFKGFPMLSSAQTFSQSYVFSKSQ